MPSDTHSTQHDTQHSTQPLTIDIFCTVIDNYGDAGVCWRLVQQLAQREQQVQRVRLWTDSPELIARLCPAPPDTVEVLHWDSRSDTLATELYAGDMVIEAFGCNFDHRFVARRLQAGLPPPQWVNLEYLSAESWVQDCHGLPSPIMHGVCAGLQKTFVFPGFSPRTGGLLLESNLPQRMAHFDRLTWLRQLNPDVDWRGRYIVSLFCYPHAPVQQLLAELLTRADQQPVALLVCAGHPTRLVQSLLKEQPVLRKNMQSRLHIEYLPFMPQAEFDHLLWAGDFNCVRGEDSIVRAVAAGKPFLWHIYPQDDGAHTAKLAAFLAVTGMQQTHNAHRLWNSISDSDSNSSDSCNTQLLHTHAVGSEVLTGLFSRSLVDCLLSIACPPVTGSIP